MLFNANSRSEILHKVLSESHHLDLPLLERSLNALIDQEWEFINLVKESYTSEELSRKKKVAYQYEILLLAIAKCNRG